MAQDYHIYLHSEGTSGGLNSSGNKTQPFSKTQSQESGNAFSTGIKTAFSTTKNIINGGAVNTGVSYLTKVAPYVAVVVAGIGVADKILTTGFAHQEEYTGNYKNNMQYNNFKTVLRIFTNPIGYARSAIHTHFQYNKQNKEIIEQNRLIGNSILKDFNIGV